MPDISKLEKQILYISAVEYMYFWLGCMKMSELPEADPGNELFDSAFHLFFIITIYTSIMGRELIYCDSPDRKNRLLRKHGTACFFIFYIMLAGIDVFLNILCFSLYGKWLAILLLLAKFAVVFRLGALVLRMSKAADTAIAEENRIIKFLLVFSMTAVILLFTADVIAAVLGSPASLETGLLKILFMSCILFCFVRRGGEYTD